MRGRQQAHPSATWQMFGRQQARPSVTRPLFDGQQAHPSATWQMFDSQRARPSATRPFFTHQPPPVGARQAAKPPAPAASPALRLSRPRRSHERPFAMRLAKREEKGE